MVAGAVADPLGGLGGGEHWPPGAVHRRRRGQVGPAAAAGGRRAPTATAPRPGGASNIHTIAPYIHTIAPNIHTIAPNIHNIAPNIHTIAPNIPPPVPQVSGACHALVEAVEAALTEAIQ
eukprot:439969-Prorocentrum_minimum.AAC.1